MKGNADCRIYTEQGRENHERTFSRESCGEPCANEECRFYQEESESRCMKHSLYGADLLCEWYRSR